MIPKRERLTVLSGEGGDRHRPIFKMQIRALSPNGNMEARLTGVASSAADGKVQLPPFLSGLEPAVWRLIYSLQEPGVQVPPLSLPNPK